MKNTDKTNENNIQKKSAKAVKYILMVFVAVSIGAAVYKMLPCCSGNKSQAAPVEAVAAAAQEPSVKVEPKALAKAAKPVVKAAVEAKTAVVYYFYTNARCYSCKLIEAYTREAIVKNFSADYKGWKVVFKGINLDEQENKHFIQDYQLNSKSVVVQKKSGEKSLKWKNLKKVWQLLGDKNNFMDYVTNETNKLLDEK